jgi:hypothetical protein
MNEKQIVSAIIKRHGAVIDLRARPSVIIDIIRQFGYGADEPGTPDPPDGGSAPGGAPKPPPPDPSRMGSIVQLDDVMKVLLKVSRDVARLNTQFLAVSAKASVARTAAKRKRARRG